MNQKQTEQGTQPLFKKVIAAAMLVAMCGAEAQAQLGPQYTPNGAIKAASADGVIPAWVPPGPQDVGGWTYGKYRGDHFKYKDDKPLYTIDATNYEKYAEKLSAGQIEAIKKIKGYKLIVYPTRRTCGVPDFVAENSKKNFGFAKMDTATNGLKEAYIPGAPFLIPKTGAEAMWNAKMRYRGVAVYGPKTALAVSPKPGNDAWIETIAEQFYVLPWGKRGTTTFSQANEIEAYAYYVFLKPASYVGQAGVFTLRASEPAETFIYFPGQKRVRRMPAYTYDSPALGTDNQYNIDEANIFFGQMDRFDWKLMPAKEMVVQYNSFGQYNINAKFEDIAKRDLIEPTQLRWEIHRMIPIELTLRAGMRHVAPKRIIYLDEDSWALGSMVDFDAKGSVAKFREAGIIPVYETGACDSQAFAQYNLGEGRYMTDFMTASTGADLKWVVDGGDNPKFKASFFTSDNLRAISDR